MTQPTPSAHHFKTAAWLSLGIVTVVAWFTGPWVSGAMATFAALFVPLCFPRRTLEGKGRPLFLLIAGCAVAIPAVEMGRVALYQRRAEKILPRLEGAADPGAIFEAERGRLFNGMSVWPLPEGRWQIRFPDRWTLVDDWVLSSGSRFWGHSNETP